MKKSYSAALIALFAAYFCSAQKVDLTPFYSSLYTPPELNEDPAGRLKKLYEEYKAGNNGTEIDQKAFVYEYNFFLDKLNKSGKVFFGDPISTYLNELKDAIVTDPQLRERIHVYLVDFPYLNAFTNDFGNIYVNVASIASLDSEEELLLMLAHEIGHILLHHSYEAEAFRNKKKDRKEKWTVTEETAEFQQHAFSRSQELQADSVAFALLKGKVDLSKGLDLFHRLKLSDNPVYPGKVDFNLLTGGNTALATELENYWLGMAQDTVYYPIATSDSLSTHPSVEKRIEKWKEYLAGYTGADVDYVPKRSFADYKQTAIYLLLNTYREEDEPLRALDLVLKMRAADPEDTYLIGQQVRILTLLSQSRNTEIPVERILNTSGDACDDPDYLRLKKMLLELSPADVNIMTWLSQQSLLSETELADNTAARKNYYQLYFNHDTLFFNEGDNIHYMEWHPELDSVKAPKNNAQILRKKLEKEGFYFVEPNATHLLVKMLLTGEQPDSTQNAWIARANALKQELKYQESADAGDLFVHPEWAAKLHRKGTFYRSSDFDPTKNSSLFQADHYYFKSKRRGDFKVDYEKTLELENDVLKLTDQYNPYSKNYSNLHGQQVTVADNYLHRIIWNWMIERGESDPLAYSKMEDEIGLWLSTNEMKYLVYNICIVNKNRGLGRKYNLNYYEIYFDMETQTVSYVSKLGSHLNPDKHVLENFIYQSNYHKNHD